MPFVGASVPAISVYAVAKQALSSVRQQAGSYRLFS